VSEEIQTHQFVIIFGDKCRSEGHQKRCNDVVARLG
jgi:hypothetical protein